MDTNLRVENIGEAVALTADIVCADDIAELMYRLDAQHRQDAVFLFDAPARVTILKLKTGDGQYLWKGGWEGSWKRLCGYEVSLCENLPSTTKGKHAVIFASRLYAARQDWIDWPADLDWQCEYCGRTNAGTRTGCISCGGPRSWADYGS